MDDSARKFARRILLMHGLILIIVLAAMAAAAREIYQSTREQMVVQAEDRQKQLAKQTASGIESHYQSILNDLDLLHRAENDATGTEIPGTEQKPLSIADRAADRAVGGRAPLIGQVMWKQLEGRISLLFSRDHVSPTNAVVLTHLIGSDDPRLLIESIVAKSGQWIDQLKAPSFSRFGNYNGVGANLICIPMARRDLVAVVPIAGIEKQFLQPLNDDTATGAWLIDEAGTAMAASRVELVGISVTSIADPELHALATQYIENHASGTHIIPHSFKIGTSRFAPAMITATPVIVGNKQWELFVTTSLDDVDGVVAKLFHRALLWCIFVVISVTAILVSTAVQMIRSRVRMERVQHDLLTKELSQAREIQLAWLPDQQPSGGIIDIAAINSPASHISGDFYNWFELPDGRVVVTIGDVTGHGMSAAFLMATTQLLVRNTMIRIGDPGRCLEEVNRQLCVQVFNGQFVTMSVVILDVANAQMEVATAGHPSPLLADGESFQPIPLEPQLVLGVDRDTRYETEKFPLSTEASLLLYTDGVVECADVQYARFGVERLRRALYGRYDTAQEILDRVVNAVDGFRGTRMLDDDLTLVAIQLLPMPISKATAASASV